MREGTQRSKALYGIDDVVEFLSNIVEAMHLGQCNIFFFGDDRQVTGGLGNLNATRICVCVYVCSVCSV